ncbi:hypothetical protein HUJ05_010963 [Dendroctonus ponderosae]|nr:hypothetical protein HUJ05_010963 [Dendroctonus ponderosae]
MEPPELDNNNGNNTVLVFRAATRATLSNLLNPMKLLPNDKGVPRAPARGVWLSCPATELFSASLWGSWEPPYSPIGSRGGFLCKGWPTVWSCGTQPFYPLGICSLVGPKPNISSIYRLQQ